MFHSLILIDKPIDSLVIRSHTGRIAKFDMVDKLDDNCMFVCHRLKAFARHDHVQCKASIYVWYESRF